MSHRRILRLNLYLEVSVAIVAYDAWSEGWIRQEELWLEKDIARNWIFLSVFEAWDKNTGIYSVEESQ